MNNTQLLSFAFALFYLAGCGAGDEGASDPTAPQPMKTIASSDSPVEMVGDVVVVKMTGNDQMRYNVAEFTAKVGQTVRVTLENIGRMPKAAMGHNVVFLNPGADENAYVAAAAQSKDTDYIPESEDSFAYSKLLGPGESDKIEFTVNEVGEYTFLCSFPAHLYAGMRGVMTVVE